MKSEVVASLIIAGAGLGWTIYTYLADKRHFLREKKAEFFQRVLASEEELHEAYFDGKPPSHSGAEHQDWYLSDYGWRREDHWAKSERYLAASRDMNWCLAGINLFSTLEISMKCEDLENISHMSESEKADDGEDRQTKMNSLVNLMRRDLNSWAPSVTLSWA